ncbi:sodium/hydrogen exchanger 9B2 isoform X2 [Coccinella septempunctata]|nr:sodium/hydrogen exchanger 9B2 isoform X2 [Coccinella septempunctata]
MATRKISAMSANADRKGPVRKKNLLASTLDIPGNNTQSPLMEPPSSNRRVSIIGIDNPGFESPSRNRKTSATSDHILEGPVRKKSSMVNSFQKNDYDSGKHSSNGDAHIKKHSVADSVHSKTRFSEIDENENRSWWYTFCIRCRSEESHPSWQPTFWSSMCPYPFCPTYRQFSRLVALILIGTLSYCVLYAIVGETAAPGGKVYTLIILSICAHLGGWLMSLTTLPALIGMLFVGLIFQNVGVVDIDDSYSDITKELRNIALVIILIRAGLDLDPHALKRLKFTVLKLGLGPWFIEMITVAIFALYLLELPLSWALLLGCIVAAVSPAVVVPCLFRLRTKGYGVAKGIPTLIIAVAGICDALSVAIFGIGKSIMFSDDSVTSQILSGPVSVIGGLGFGVLWGVICNYTPEKHDPFMVPLRILLLLVGGMISVFGSDLIGYGGAGPLGCVTAAFMAIFFWSNQGWEIEDNPAATAFEIFWMIFEPILFGVTGTQIKINELDPEIVTYSLAILIVGVLIRIVLTILIGIGCKLNLKEKLFVALSWMSKATVQAALGPVTLGIVAEDSEEHEYAKKVLMVCILSILLTAPTGAILISLGGPRLLTKTKFPDVPEGWRRSHRPSIRDISIIDEEEEKSDIETANIENSISYREKSADENT